MRSRLALQLVEPDDLPWSVDRSPDESLESISDPIARGVYRAKLERGIERETFTDTTRPARPVRRDPR